MSQPKPIQEVHHHDAFDHIEEEIRSLEGVTRWSRPLHVGALVIAVIALVGGIVWLVMSPPQTTSRRTAYAPTTGSRMEVSEPQGGTLDEPPVRFAWESVTGRLQYIVRVYVKGSSVPVLERMATSTSIELSPDERAKIPRGTSFVWTVVAQGKDGSTIGAGQSTFKVR